MNGGPSGFHNAPVTKTIVICTVLFTIPFGIRGQSKKLGISYQDIYEKINLWRLISSVFAFASTPELIFGSCLLYYFRVFERQIGSNKYAVFVAFSMIVSLIFEILALGYLKDFSLNKLTPGPYTLIFSSFVPFFFDIPISSKFRVLTLNLSDKSFIYLAGLQSLIPGLCGIITGCFYRLNTFSIRRFKFPDAMTSMFSNMTSYFSRNSSRNSSNQQLPSYSIQQSEANNQAEEMVPLVEGPSDETLATLMSMGFDRDSAMQALVLTRNDLDLSTSILLETQSH